MNCYHTVSVDYLFCPTCGAKQLRKVCRCFAINSVDALFCVRCGYALEEAEEIIRTLDLDNKYDLAELIAVTEGDSDILAKEAVVQPEKMAQDDINDLFQGNGKHENKRETDQ